MDNKTNIIIILLLINLLATGIIGHSYFSNVDNSETEVLNFNNGNINNNSLNYTKEDKYTLYIGTNDKDTKTAISTEEATNIVNAICDKYVNGYSVFNSKGYWTNNLNQSEHEATLVYTFYNVTENQIINILDETLKELNQQSILVEKEDAYYTYYEN